jgi:hypothetical protein
LRRCRGRGGYHGLGRLDSDHAEGRTGLLARSSSRELERAGASEQSSTKRSLFVRGEGMAYIRRRWQGDVRNAGEKRRRGTAGLLFSCFSQ